MASPSRRRRDSPHRRHGAAATPIGTRAPEPAPPDQRQKEPDPTPPKPSPSPPVVRAAPIAPAPKLSGVVYDLDLTGRGRAPVAPHGRHDKRLSPQTFQVSGDGLQNSTDLVDTTTSRGDRHRLARTNHIGQR